MDNQTNSNEIETNQTNSIKPNSSTNTQPVSNNSMMNKFYTCVCRNSKISILLLCSVTAVLGFFGGKKYTQYKSTKEN